MLSLTLSITRFTSFSLFSTYVDMSFPLLQNVRSNKMTFLFFTTFSKKWIKFQNCTWQNEHSFGINVPISGLHFSILSAILVPELPFERQMQPGYSSTQNIFLFCLFFPVMCKTFVMDIRRDSGSVWLLNLAPAGRALFSVSFLFWHHIWLTTQSVTVCSTVLWVFEVLRDLIL